MKFYVRRTSGHDDTRPPCKDAVPQYGLSMAGRNDYIAAWTVEIPDLDALRVFVVGVGEDVILKANDDGSMHAEIYDELRE